MLLRGLLASSHVVSYNDLKLLHRLSLHSMAILIEKPCHTVTSEAIRSRRQETTATAIDLY